MAVATRSLAEFAAHFWTPSDPKYLDYSWSFDQTSRAMVDPGLLYESSSPGFSRLGRAERIQILNISARYAVSVLAGLEACALRAYTRLAELGEDVALELSEEARHVQSFTRFLDLRWGGALNVDGFWAELEAVVASCDRKDDYRGLIAAAECLNLGILTSLHHLGQDPLLVRACSFAIADETHHGFASSSGTRKGKEVGQVLVDTLVERLSASALASVYEQQGVLFSPAGCPVDASFLCSAVANFATRGGWDVQAPDAVRFDFDALAHQIGVSASHFLKQFEVTDDPTPDQHLAVAWMVAGLRGTAHWEIKRTQEAQLCP